MPDLTGIGADDVDSEAFESCDEGTGAEHDADATMRASARDPMAELAASMACDMSDCESALDSDADANDHDLALVSECPWSGVFKSDVNLLVSRHSALLEAAHLDESDRSSVDGDDSDSGEHDAEAWNGFVNTAFLLNLQLCSEYFAPECDFRTPPLTCHD